MRKPNIFLAGIAMQLMPTMLWAGEQPTAALEALDDGLPGTLINNPTRLDWPIFGPGLTIKPIKTSTDITVAFYARTVSAEISDGQARTGMHLQQNKAPYSGFNENALTLGTNWRLLQIKTIARSAIPQGKAVSSLHFNAAAQAIEVGQVYILNSSTPELNVLQAPTP
jgi:hypothetical protein